MCGDMRIDDCELRAWASAIPPEPGPFTRLRRALFGRFARRRVGWGYYGGDMPPEGAGVPARPKRPAPTLLAAAELELPPE
jgi:hypothetical protein